MSIAAVRAGLADALADVPGLRVSPYYPDLINPPMAFVAGYRIEFDASFRRGSDTITFNVTVAVHRQSERTAAVELDTFAPLVKAAIEADMSLGGTCDSLQVTALSEAVPLVIGETTYLAATYAVTVIATA